MSISSIPKVLIRFSIFIFHISHLNHELKATTPTATPTSSSECIEASGERGGGTSVTWCVGIGGCLFVGCILRSSLRVVTRDGDGGDGLVDCLPHRGVGATKGGAVGLLGIGERIVTG
jgi:hypothetical protein